jgi:hypothetical protein
MTRPPFPLDLSPPRRILAVLYIEKSRGSRMAERSHDGRPLEPDAGNADEGSEESAMRFPAWLYFFNRG